MEQQQKHELRLRILKTAIEASNDDFRPLYEGIYSHYLENGYISKRQLENVQRVCGYLF